MSSGSMGSNDGRSDRHPEHDLLRLRSGGSRPESWAEASPYPGTTMNSQDVRTKEEITLMDVTNGIKALHELRNGTPRGLDDDVKLSPEQIEALGLSASLPSSAFNCCSRRSPSARLKVSTPTSSDAPVTFHSRRSPSDPCFSTSPARFSPHPPPFSTHNAQQWWTETPSPNVVYPESTLISSPHAADPFESQNPALKHVEQLSREDDEAPYTAMEKGVSCLSILSNVTVNLEFPVQKHPAAKEPAGEQQQEKKKRRKYRRTKDCDLPKKPKTPYTFFQLSVMDQIWAEVEASAQAVGQSREALSRLVARLTGQRWRAMSVEGRKQFTDLAASDSERYKLECAEYARKNSLCHPDNKQLAKLFKMRGALSRRDDIEVDENDEEASYLPTHFMHPAEPQARACSKAQPSMPEGSSYMAMHQTAYGHFDPNQITPELLEAFRQQMEMQNTQIPGWY